MEDLSGVLKFQINKLKNLKVAQLKDDDGGGVVNACLNGCVSDVLCDVVCDVMFDVVCGGVGDGVSCGEGLGKVK